MRKKFLMKFQCHNFNINRFSTFHRVTLFCPFCLNSSYDSSGLFVRSEKVRLSEVLGGEKQSGGNTASHGLGEGTVFTFTGRRG